MAQLTAHPALISLDAHKTLPPLAEIALRVAVVVAQWDERRRTRRALKQIDPALLRDVGLTGSQASAEARKYFWMA